MTRVFNGEVYAGLPVALSTQVDKIYEVKEVGILIPERTPLPKLTEGQVGYVLIGIKDPKLSVQNLGCTILQKSDHIAIKVPTEKEIEASSIDLGKSSSEKASSTHGAIYSIPSFQKAKQLVFCCLYPDDPEEFQQLDAAIHKLILEDPGVSLTVESSPALGTGYRCGFLGVFHMEIFRERLFTEYNLKTISTFPTVVYRAVLSDGSKQDVHNVLEAPTNCTWEEPWVLAQIMCRREYEAVIKSLAEPRRGVFKHTKEMEDGHIYVI